MTTEAFEDRLSTVAIHAWERWTNNGLRLDDEDQAETMKSAADAACNVYTDGMTDMEWLKATLARLGVA